MKLTRDYKLHLQVLVKNRVEFINIWMTCSCKIDWLVEKRTRTKVYFRVFWWQTGIAHIFFDCGLSTWFFSDHEIYLEQKRSLFHVTISALRNCAIICCLFRFGSTAYKCLNPYNSTTTYHSVPLCTDVYDENGPPFQVDLFFRSNDSFVLCNENRCNTCLNYINKEAKKKCVPAKQSLPIKDKAHLTACSKR